MSDWDAGFEYEYDDGMMDYDRWEEEQVFQDREWDDDSYYGPDDDDDEYIEDSFDPYFDGAF